MLARRCDRGKFSRLHTIAAFASRACHSLHSGRTESPPVPSLMAPYDFDAPDADAILRSSDGKEFRVHRLILSLSSPVFQGMFSLPRITGSSPELPIIDVPERSDILQLFLQYLYPRSPPRVTDISMWAALYTIADKYGTEVVMDPLRDMLIPRFLETSPLRVYALASCWGFEEAKTASRRTLTIDISEGFSEEDAELMGSVACQKLYLLHIRRREKAQALVGDHPYRLSEEESRECPPVDSGAVVQALKRCVSKRPWLTAEELYNEAAMVGESQACYGDCRNAFENIHEWFTSILEEMSELPQTI